MNNCECGHMQMDHDYNQGECFWSYNCDCKSFKLATGGSMIDKPYAYHKPSDDGLIKINRLREHFSQGERLIREVCGDVRQASIAITNNEQTAMWAIKAVVFNDPKSEATA